MGMRSAVAAEDTQQHKSQRAAHSGTHRLLLWQVMKDTPTTCSGDTQAELIFPVEHIIPPHMTAEAKGPRRSAA